MSEPLRVELNRGSVHAIEASESFTAEGPFHIELHNAGGAVHVHLHLDDDLSTVARLDDVNHFVEEGATKRVPVGVRPNRDPRTGRLKVVSGYGAEEEYVDLTVVPKSNQQMDSRGTRNAERTESDAAGSTRGAATSPGGEPVSSEGTSPNGAATSDRTGVSGGAEANGESAATDGSTARDRQAASAGTPTDDGSGAADRTSRTSPDDYGNTDSSAESTVRTAAGRSGPQSTRGRLRDAARLESLQSAVSALRESPEAITFLALAAVAVIVGIGVITVVSELLLAFVVAAVVGGAVAVAGWLLLR